MTRAIAKSRMKKHHHKSPQSSLDDGSTNTRQRLLEVAGQVFAEKGFDRTTSKEITERAGTNVASVNYYFEGFEGLYAAVLDEAAGLLVTSADVQTAVAEHLEAKAKLEAFLGLFVQVLTSPASSSWRLRVLVREFTSPTLRDQSPHNKERLQKLNILKGIVGELMGLPEEHPSVARGCISVLAPCLMLFLCDRPTLKQAFPQFGLHPDDAPALIRHMVQFTLAGLSAVAKDVLKADLGRGRSKRGLGSSRSPTSK